MERIPVQSSNLASVRFDATTLTLEVEFLTGGIYQYYGVGADVYEGLMTAGSKGSFLSQFVKKGGYPVSKIS